MNSVNVGRDLWVKLAFVFAAILCIKALFLFFDHEPAYFIGDSASYLATATIKWIPPDRSFLYGFFIRRVAFHSHSLEALIWVQSFLSAVTAWLLSFGLLFLFHVRFRVAAVFGVLCAIEPLELLMERYVMTETVSNFLFVVYFLLLLRYINTGRLWPLLLAQVLGILTVGIRVSFLPDVLIGSVMAPLLSPNALEFWRDVWARLRRKTTSAHFHQLRTVTLHVVVSVLVSQATLTAYENLNGHLSKREPAILYENGAFLLSDFAPIIEPEDFPNVPQREAIFRNQKFDRHDLLNRPFEHFVDGGLWAMIRKEFPDPKQANEVASRAALHALGRQPLGAARLALHTFVLYFDAKRLHEWLLVDEGTVGELDKNSRSVLQNIYHVSNPKTYQPSLTKSWHLAAEPWYWIVLGGLCLSPVLIFLCRPSERPSVALCIVTALIFLEGATLTVDRPTPRFLTTDAWLALLLFGFSTELVIRSARNRQNTFDNGAPGVRADNRTLRG